MLRFDWTSWLSQQGFGTNVILIGVALSSINQWLA